MSERYVLKRDFSASLTGPFAPGDVSDWSVYDAADPRHGTSDEWPIAAFAKRSDAIQFRNMKNGRKP